MTTLIHSLEPLIPALRRYARALVRDPWDADDLVQDCLERAISRWHQRRGDEGGNSGNTRAWVFTILHHLAMTRLRRAARRPRPVALDEVDGSSETMMDRMTGDGGPSGRENPQESWLHCQDILDALSRLPVDQRTVLLLVTVEDLSYAEAARVLDIPVGTVMSRLSRARDRLHQTLAHEALPTLSRPRLHAVPSNPPLRPSALRSVK